MPLHIALMVQQRKVEDSKRSRRVMSPQPSRICSSMSSHAMSEFDELDADVIVSFKNGLR